MIYEQAIKTIQIAKAEVEWNYPMEYQEALDIAIDCIEKQIPKKPVKTDLWEMCPTCYEKFGFDFDILVGMRGLKTGLCYCLNCGQRIADSEVE